MKKFFYLIIPLFLTLSFQDNDTYLNEVNEWHSNRIKSLTSPTSWLSLAGLFWLEEGRNTFGSDTTNQIIFPENTAPFMGSFFLRDSVVSIKINNGISVTHEGSPVAEMILLNDHQQNTTILNYNTLSWYILKRGQMVGIRLRDSAHSNLRNFNGIDRFPVDKKWKIPARLEKYPSPKTIKVPNVLGQIEDMPCPGVLIFKIDGVEYKLDPVADDNSTRYWIIFADATNDNETYGAGRFLYMDAADENGLTYIDFNRSYNPPCVFSPFATCPLPPEQNRINARITAGEKMWHGSHN